MLEIQQPLGSARREALPDFARTIIHTTTFGYLDFDGSARSYMEDQQYTISVEHGPAQEPNSESDTTPPNTILVRWKKELLLLDAWNEEGVSSTIPSPVCDYTERELLQDKLRTPPSLIGEAIKHFRIGKKQDIDNFRLAVHELVDDRPALLFLGLTALRFVESKHFSVESKRRLWSLTLSLCNPLDGRVLELIDLRESSSPSPSHSRPSSPAMKPDDSGTETYKTAPLGRCCEATPCNEND